MKILIRNIRQLVGVENPDVPLKQRVSGQQMAKLPVVDNAFLLIGDGKIENFGKMEDCPSEDNKAGKMQLIDAAECLVLPAFCDSHSHIVFAGSRENEFIDKIKGLSYEEIAKRGGGILNSANKLHDTSEEELLDQALPRLAEIIKHGTGAIEIKSGYGLNTEDELKMLRVIRTLKEKSPLTIKATFFGAHAVPLEYKDRQTKYVDLVINETLPKVVAEGLADYVDVFCDKGFFTVQDTDRILSAAAKLGLRPKIHANELDYSGGIQVGVKYNALSVDHLEFTGNEEIRSLLGRETMPTILPGASFFLGLPWAPARKMIDAGLAVAMASDYNPGSSPSGNMQFILSLACIKYKLLPEEAIHTVTLNSAYAMGVSKELGSIAIGKIANVFITQPMPSFAFMPYAFGTNKVDKVILNGKVV